jgi:mono/diheme cytochrome c family protein
MRRAWLVLLISAGCVGTPEIPDAGSDAGSTDAGQTDAGSIDAGPTDAGQTGLPIRHLADGGAAARGKSLFTDGKLGGQMFPRLAIRNLWVVWGTGQPPTDAAYWEAFRARYGLAVAPYPNEGYPLGIHGVDAMTATIDCLACHAGNVAGSVVIGVGNSEFDLQGLFDDLAALAAVAPMFGFPAYTLPYTLSNRTGSAGANDAMGLGMTLAKRAAPGATINTEYGFQRAPAWWSLKHKSVHYTDGSGESGGTRPMMATLLASTTTLAQLQAQDAAFADLYQYLLTLEAPAWPFTVDAALAAKGRAVFSTACASCHGVYQGATSFPDRVVPRAEVGTDPIRAERFGSAEAAFVNASWFGADHPMRSTGGYLAPVLTGVWANAPYFHNGSVPTLEAVLDSSKRLTRWRRVGHGTADYDPAAVGWKVTSATAVGQATIDARRTYDTTAPALSNAGHVYGDALSAEDRRAVLEYLKTL